MSVPAAPSSRFTPADAAALLASTGRPAAAEPAPTPVSGGWASWTFAVAGTHILRVARTPEIAAAHRREERLLPVLAPTLDFAVPVPEHVGVYEGRTFMLYRMLPGRALAAGDRLDRVAGMLRGLHAFPVERAGALLGCGTSPADWRAEYEADRAWIDAVVLPVLDPRLRETVARAYDAAVAGLGGGFTPVLVHRDLGTEHILCDPATGVPTGMIDFETAHVGDPAIDFVGLHITFGEAAVRKVIAAYGTPVPLDRLRFYVWMGAVHAIRYGVEEGDAALVAEAVAGLRERITAAAR